MLNSCLELRLLRIGEYIGLYVFVLRLRKLEESEKVHWRRLRYKSEKNTDIYISFLLFYKYYKILIFMRKVEREEQWSLRNKC